MQDDDKALYLRFILIFFLAQLYQAGGNFFVAPRFASIGVELSTISNIIALGFLAGIFGQCFLGYIITKHGNIKFIFMHILMLLTSAILMVYTVPFVSIKTLIFFQCVIGFSLNIVVGLLDTWVMGINVFIQGKYGIIRSGAAFGQVVGACLLGFLIYKLGFIVVGLFSLCIFPLLYQAIKPVPNVTISNKSISFKDLKELISHKPYAITVLVYFMLFMFTTAENTISSLKLSTFNNPSSFGYYYAIFGIVEGISMTIVPRLTKKIPIQYFMLVALFGYMLKIPFFIFASSPKGMYLGASVTGLIAFPSLLIASRYMIKSVIPPKFYSIGMMAGVAATGSVAGVISGLMVGLIVDNIGITRTYLVYGGYAILLWFIIIRYIKYYTKYLKQSEA